MIAQASFEDFIYVIIGILWVVFSFYNAKKKKEAKNASAPTNKKKSILESLLDEVGYNNEQDDSALYEKEVNQADAVPITSQEKESTEVFSYDDDYEESNHESNINVIKKEPLTPTVNKDGGHSKILKNNRNNKIKKKIDLRKAVIYSEIINKVYF